MYLQPIFDSPDITKQLPAEAKKFRSVDMGWRTVMNRVHKDPAALAQSRAKLAAAAGCCSRMMRTWINCVLKMCIYS